MPWSWEGIGCWVTDRSFDVSGRRSETKINYHPPSSTDDFHTTVTSSLHWSVLETETAVLMPRLQLRHDFDSTAVRLLTKVHSGLSDVTHHGPLTR